MVEDGFPESVAPANLVDHVNGFKRHLYVAQDLAKEGLSGSQSKTKEQVVLRAENHTFLPGEKVLVLSPILTSPFQAKFTGPYSVLEELSDENYLI